MDAHVDGYDPDVTVLVPSCAEEVPVVRATLWSAALREPRVRIAAAFVPPRAAWEDATAAIRAHRGWIAGRAQRVDATPAC